LHALPYPYEIIFVDDGSTDHGSHIIEELCRKEASVKMISLGRNFGHQIALTAGLRHAAGDAVITMDGDFQHPPELIPRMVEKWLEGFDIVYTTKTAQAERSLLKGLLASAFYGIFNRISDIHLDPNASDFRLLDRKALNVLNQMPEQQRFIRGLVSWMGFAQTRMSYVAPPRKAGRPKYSIRRLGQLASYGIASFTTLPLKIPLYISLILFILFVIYGGHLITSRLIDDRLISEISILYLFLLFISILVTGILGIFGYYLSKIYQEVRKRPLYTVKGTKGLGSPPRPDQPGQERIRGESRDVTTP
jgi:dolichol-phosphate mannosyltransferase